MDRAPLSFPKDDLHSLIDDITQIAGIWPEIRDPEATPEREMASLLFTLIRERSEAAARAMTGMPS